MTNERIKQADRIGVEFSPFIKELPKFNKKDKPMHEVLAQTIHDTFKYMHDWTFKGHFVYKGVTYRKGINEASARIVLASIYK